MNPVAIVLALTAAVFHAGWNLIVKSAPDRVLGAWVVSTGGGLINVVVLAVIGLPDRSVWWLIVLSSVVQTAYMILLGTAYRSGDLSFVFPIARGSAPFFITLTGYLLLGERVGVLTLLGVAIVVTSLVSLTLGGRDRSGLGWALATGASIAAYTTIDAISVRTQGNAIPVVAGVFVIHALMFTVVMLVTRGPVAMVEAVRVNPRRSVIGGFGTAMSYGLVMAATLFGPLGPVTAVRESSVILGVAAGRRMLGEKVDRRHLIAVGLCLSGIVLIAVS